MAIHKHTDFKTGETFFLGFPTDGMPIRGNSREEVYKKYRERKQR